jgi:inosine-uridine nucleoside N-ribohydrolase
MKIVGAGLATSLFCSSFVYGKIPEKKGLKIPVLHATDLFRPHMDPDDHWDLACIYALAYRGDIDLKGIVIDHPPHNRKDLNPDTMAVAQMNLICGIYAPVAVGSPLPLKSRNDIQPNASSMDHHGVRMVLDVLRKSPQPVTINILGSSRDVAIAANMAPELFASKCAAIYLNAGTGSPKMSQVSKLEYNVTLDKFAYAAIFDSPCPVYWMPCFEEMETLNKQAVRQYGTHYKLRQDEILPHLPEMVQNYFAYMFGRYTDSNWLNYLKGESDKALLSKVGDMYRHMWCTGGFLHAAGCTVSHGGKIVSLNDKSNLLVFTFDPIRVRCHDNGLTKWTHDNNAINRFIFHVRDTGKYQSAMTQAMKSLLMTLP